MTATSEVDIYEPCSPIDFSQAPPELPIEYQLDLKRRTDSDYKKPPQLFYGFGLNIQHVLEYHRDHQLPPPPSDIQRNRA
ncbi:hypothetical protein GYMLUDRAFT_590162 [Collybiopsis luxurians FD-317 M1]|uniref:Uncharacterized protein n=1 Tax=Collybiopsis luxurians FD-317 M1 TaxID=944289 RepID=A0A0D0CEZ5_9AGAR|nr:hypothetical protein GYMLUDRAFT_590162 [Collybiopsis luxurians FD-317 M1]